MILTISCSQSVESRCTRYFPLRQDTTFPSSATLLSSFARTGRQNLLMSSRQALRSTGFSRKSALCCSRRFRTTCRHLSSKPKSYLASCFHTKKNKKNYVGNPHKVSLIPRDPHD